jgi:transcription-repair coupling factor (superfamily II helicase)
VLPFPSTQVDPYRGFQPHLKVASARARVLHALATGTARVSCRIGARRCSPSCRSRDDPVVVARDQAGIDIDPHELANTLVLGGYEPADPVDAHGEFARRGGIFDVFPAGEELPIRIEFIGDTVESIRRFDPGTQRSSRRSIASASFQSANCLGSDPLHRICFSSCVRATAQVWLSEPTDVKTHQEALGADRRAVRRCVERRKGRAPAADDLLVTEDEIAAELATRRSRRAGDRDAGSADQVSCLVQPTRRFTDAFPTGSTTSSRAGEWRSRRVRRRLARPRGTHGRTAEGLRRPRGDGVGRGDVVRGAVMVAEGWLSKGFRLRNPQPPRSRSPLSLRRNRCLRRGAPQDRRGKKRSASAAFLSDLRDLKVDDLIVHVDHGIGQFVGLKQNLDRRRRHRPGIPRARYHGDAKLFVPVERLDLIRNTPADRSRRSIASAARRWEKAKTKVKKAMRDMARSCSSSTPRARPCPGHAFGADTHWQEEFEDAFEFDLTPDQSPAIADIKRDMESPTPMDRLLCGDVGYGKTEVSMRAAFKAVMEGKQVAFLAPTTVWPRSI